MRVTGGEENPRVKLHSSADEMPAGRDAWWRETESVSVANAVVAALNSIKRAQDWRLRQALIYGRLYANQALDSLYSIGIVRGSGSAIAGDEVAQVVGHRVTYNVVQSCVDTAAAKISKNRPRVVFLTSQGDYSQQRRAKQLTKFVDGLFYGCDLYSETERAFIDAGVWGTGAIKVCADKDTGRIWGERILPFEVWADDAEAIYGKPPVLYHEKYIHRDVLLDEYGDSPAAKAAILSAHATVGDTIDLGTSEMVQVTESWRLPTTPGAKDGRHVIAIAGACLKDEPWVHDWHPILFFHWNPKLVGLWGQGIAEQLTGLQIEINKLLRVIQRAQHLYSVPRTFVEEGSSVSTKDINNEIGAIVKYRGAKPVTETWPAISAELYNHLESLYRKAFELTGISQLSANSMKPAGLDAAVAIREFHDIESERFVKTGQRWEQFHVDIAKAMIELAKALYDGKRDVVVRAPGTKFLEQISWSKIRLDEDQYLMKPFPASILPTTPSAKLQTAQELMKAQILDREQFLMLLDIPDLDATLAPEIVALEDIKRVIERIVDDGEYEPPEPYMNLGRCVKMAQSAIFAARRDGVPAKHIELLLRFADEADAMAREIASGARTPTGSEPPPPPAPAPPPEAMPPGQPGLENPIQPQSQIEALPSAVSAIPAPQM